MCPGFPEQTQKTCINWQSTDVIAMCSSQTFVLDMLDALRHNMRSLDHGQF